jgi:hypothetical protein
MPRHERYTENLEIGAISQILLEKKNANIIGMVTKSLKTEISPVQFLSVNFHLPTPLYEFIVMCMIVHLCRF